MKEEISSLLLHHLIKELQILKEGKLDKVYQMPDHDFYLQFHVTGRGKQLVRVVPGKYLYLAAGKPESPQTPLGYCMYLRKYLHSARLKAVQQKEFERIIEFVFEVKEETIKTRKLVIELFSKGNVILLDDQNKIMSPLETQIWKDRTIRAKELYVYPKKEYNIREMDKPMLKKLCHTTTKDSLVTCFAIDLGLGGAYAEELCLLAKLKKVKKPRDIQDNEIDHVFEAFDSLLNTALKPAVVYISELPKQVLNLIPFPLQVYEGYETKDTASLNAALDEVFTTITFEKAVQAERKVKNTKLDKVEVIIIEQQKRVHGLQKEAEESQRKGELLYENYPVVTEVLATVKKAREKYTWAEIKEKLKGNTVVVGIDEKEGTVVVDL